MVVDAFMRWPIIIFHIASQNSKNKKKKTKRSLGLLSPVSVYTMAVTVCVYECCWARCTPHEIGIVHIEGTWRRYIPFRISGPYTDRIYVYKYSYMMHKLVTYIGIYLCYCIYVNTGAPLAVWTRIARAVCNTCRAKTKNTIGMLYIWPERWTKISYVHRIISHCVCANVWMMAHGLW